MNKLIAIIPKETIGRLVSVLIITFCSSSLEVAGIASVFPFVGLLANTQLIEENIYLASIYDYLNFTNYFSFFLFIGIVTISIFLVSFLLKSYSQYLSIQFALNQEYIIGKRLFNLYLKKNYIWFLTKNSADLSKNIINEVNHVVYNVILPAINMVANLIVVIGVTIFLFIIDWFIALNMSLFFVSLYIFIFIVLKNFLKKLGDQRLNFNKDRFATLSNAFSGIKELKIFNLENKYIKVFKTHASKYAWAQKWAQTLSVLPRNLIETLGFIGIIFLAIYLIYLEEEFSTIVSILSVYAVAGYRLLPSFQNIYYCFSLMRYSEPGINLLYKDLCKAEPDDDRTFQQSSKLSKSFSKLRLENIKFRYGENLSFILSDINLELLKGKKYALIGQTGIGKTTLGDIIAGLIEPTSGKLLVDDNQVCLVGSKAWYSNLGYLPQHISLMDDTLKKNIVLKDYLSDMEEKWLKTVLEISFVDEFINDHPNDINTYVGEKGNKYSGGQLQRIGLARAIFKKPSFLILDESTSALDPFIEKELLSRLKKALPDITLFHISHKETILKDCDLIFLLCDNKTLIQDTYSNFLNKSFEFQNLMNKKNLNIN